MANNKNRVPSLRLQPLSVDFIDDRLSQYHPAFKNPSSHFDPVSGKFYVDKVYIQSMSTPGNLGLPVLMASNQSKNVGKIDPQRSMLQQDLFPEMMKSFKNEYDKEPKGRCYIKYTNRSQMDWDGVLRILIVAQDARGDAQPGAAGKVKKFAGKLNAHSTKVKKLVPLIRSNTYTSPVIIVLNVIFDAMKASNTVREELLKSLDSFRDSFEGIETYFSIYYGFPEVSRAAISLGVAILKAIEEVVGYYLQHTAFKASEALWNGEDYKKSITLSLKDITTHGEHLHREAEKANFKENHETHTGVIDANIGIQQVHDEVSELPTILKEMFLDFEYNLQRRYAQEEALRYENMYLRVENNFFRAITPPPQQGLPLPQEPHISQGDLQRLIDIPPMSGVSESYIEQTNQDLAHAIRSKQRFELAGQELPELITQSSQFRQWLVNPVSRELLIHGNGSSEPTSPLTFFCSLLIKNLINMDHFRTVFFFCGSHTRSYDPYSGGISMIKSFLAQLLSQSQFDLKFLSLDDIEQIRANNLDALRWLFKTLVQHLGREVTFFCIIEGIDFYCDPRGPHFKDMELVVDSCLELREATDMRATFKLLISCSSSTELSKFIKGDCFLNLTPEERTGIEFSSSRFEREFGNEFSERFY
ncbi:uncharacterized protein EAE97_005491 [Botrytis byssoidea]|uniref:Nephrocystin 3-like N-terminal domain-containing protein n=1 Tax=Botrytis byssoidea TaxID=139641 RepID=A0A9P5ITD7_9HELO|nr:uncharacterized protein EAE97_005491 [Botrytis byssoidea]KAF7944858.1 hypothetical protein EAE97_005491 [Botrytis byssoidea]